MKRFTQKFFLLAIGMLLSVGAYAQDEITHRFPAVTYKQSATGDDYTIPAWDIRKIDSNDGYMRFQKKANGKGMIVSAVGIKADNSNYNAQFPATVYIDGKAKTTKELRYGDIFPEMGTGSNDAGRFYIFQDEKNTPMHQITGTYTVPTSITWKGETEASDVDEIGPFAYANASAKPNYNYASRYNRVAAEKIIIPSGITTIGINAFCQDGTVTEFEFEDTEENPCQITAIPAKAFMNCINIGGIVLPSTVSYVGGCAFGGCTNLHKIIFESEECPKFDYLGGRDIFTTSSTLDEYLQNPDPTKCIIEFPLKFASDYVDSAEGAFLKEKKFPLSSPFTMSSSGLSTCCSPLDFTVKQYNTNSSSWENSDLKAFYVNSANVKEASVTLTDIDQNTKISAEEGVVLKGTAGAAYGLFFPYANVQPSSLNDLGDIDNNLFGVIEDYEFKEYDNDLYYYILNGGKFRLVTKLGTLNANKAMLIIGDNPGVVVGGGTQNALSIEFSEGTGIVNAQIEKVNDDAIYTLQGVRVKQPQKGIVIKNGKKFVIK